MNSVFRVSTLLFGTTLLMIPFLSSAIRFKNCHDLHKYGHKISGVYTIKPDHLDAFDVYCDQTTDGGGWTVFQRRIDGSVDFNRTWADYKDGFGSFLAGEFWLGLDKIHRLTRKKKKNKLRVDLGVNSAKNVYADNKGTVYAEYGWFGIANEAAEYQLNIGQLSKYTVNDSLIAHNGSKFSTWDKKHHNCFTPGMESWWFNNCRLSSNLNGIYGHDKPGRIQWGHVDPKDPNRTPKRSEMKIRPVAFEMNILTPSLGPDT